MSEYHEVLERENARLNEERKRDAILGQCTMEEAYNRITELTRERDELAKELSLCVESFIHLAKHGTGRRQKAKKTTKKGRK